MQPLFFAVVLAAGNPPEEVAPRREQIPAVAVTAQKAPEPGDPWDTRIRHLQERELAKRPHQRDELQRYRALWAEKRVDNYRFVVSIEGGWGIDNGTVVVTVRNGALASAKYSRPPLHSVRGSLDSNRPVPEPPVAPQYGTVPCLFALVEGSLDDSSTLISVSYNIDFGFPSRISTDILGASDSAFTTYVRGFEVLE